MQIRSTGRIPEQGSIPGSSGPLTMSLGAGRGKQRDRGGRQKNREQNGSGRGGQWRRGGGGEGGGEGKIIKEARQREGRRGKQEGLACFCHLARHSQGRRREPGGKRGQQCEERTVTRREWGGVSERRPWPLTSRPRAATILQGVLGEWEGAGKALNGADMH